MKIDSPSSPGLDIGSGNVNGATFDPNNFADLAQQGSSTGVDATTASNGMSLDTDATNAQPMNGANPFPLTPDPVDIPSKI